MFFIFVFRLFYVTGLGDMQSVKTDGTNIAYHPYTGRVTHILVYKVGQGHYWTDTHVLVYKVGQGNYWTDTHVLTYKVGQGNYSNDTQQLLLRWHNIKKKGNYLQQEKFCHFIRSCWSELN